MCFALASTHAGEGAGPDRLAIEGSLDDSDERTILITTLREGCIGETIAALEASRRSRTATDLAVRAALVKIADDERRHAVLAWHCVAWASLATTAHCGGRHRRAGCPAQRVAGRDCSQRAKPRRAPSSDSASSALLAAPRSAAGHSRTRSRPWLASCLGLVSANALGPWSGDVVVGDGLGVEGHDDLRRYDDGSSMRAG